MCLCYKKWYRSEGMCALVKSAAKKEWQRMCSGSVAYYCMHGANCVGCTSECVCVRACACVCLFVCVCVCRHSACTTMHFLYIYTHLCCVYTRTLVLYLHTHTCAVYTHAHLCCVCTRTLVLCIHTHTCAVYTLAHLCWYTHAHLCCVYTRTLVLCIHTHTCAVYTHAHLCFVYTRTLVLCMHTHTCAVGVVCSLMKWHKRRRQCIQGWPEPYKCTVYDRTIGDFPAKITAFIHRMRYIYIYIYGCVWMMLWCERCVEECCDAKRFYNYLYVFGSGQP
jgi:hypothetical protein